MEGQVVTFNTSTLVKPENKRNPNAHREEEEMRKEMEWRLKLRNSQENWCKNHSPPVNLPSLRFMSNVLSFPEKKDG
jgi:hypothetical protein